MSEHIARSGVIIEMRKYKAFIKYDNVKCKNSNSGLNNRYESSENCQGIHSAWTVVTMSDIMLVTVPTVLFQLSFPDVIL